MDYGSCLQAMRIQKVVSLRDTEVSQRWPELVTALEPTGIRSFLAAPLSGDPAPGARSTCTGPPTGAHQFGVRYEHGASPVVPGAESALKAAAQTFR